MSIYGTITGQPRDNREQRTGQPRDDRWTIRFRAALLWDNWPGGQPRDNRGTTHFRLPRQARDNRGTTREPRPGGTTGAAKIGSYGFYQCRNTRSFASPARTTRTETETDFPIGLTSFKPPNLRYMLM